MTSRDTLFEVVGDLLGQPALVTTTAPYLSAVGFFPHKPTNNSTIAMTKGVARTLLAQSEKQALRQELIIVVDDVVHREEAAALLGTLAQEVVERGKAIKNGEVFGPGGPLFPNSPLTALYATRPVFLPPTFAKHDGPDGVTLAVWLVPISTEEASIARSLGPHQFEEYLEAIAGDSPALFSFFRVPATARS